MSDDEKKSFWATMPGILTGTASLLTALVAVLTFTTGTCKKNNAAQPPVLGGIPQAIQLKNLDECRDITGRWEWFTGGEVRMEEDGRLEWRQVSTETLPNVIGRWTCTDTKPVQFLLSWQHGLTDTVNLSPDKKSLAGSNAAGVRVSGARKA